MKIISILSLFIFSLAPVLSKNIDLEELGWPRDIEFKKGVITIYQPQIESFENDKVVAHAAIAVKQKDKSPVFGAMRFTSRVQTDLDARLVTYDKIVIESLKFPEGDDDEVENIRKAMTEKLSGLTMTLSLERFSASIEHLVADDNQAGDFNNTPPKIYFETSPSVLIFIDGEPILKEVENSSFKYVMNSPYFLVLRPSDKKYYLKGGDWWYSSKEIEKGWNSINTPPKDVSELADNAFKGDEKDVDSLAVKLDKAPKLIVSIEPAELIQTDGEPKFEPVPGTELLFLTNSESDILMDISSQQYYILVSGRWYTSKNLDKGDWKYVGPKELPVDFEKIPENSDISDVRVSVPGTQESKDALLDNSVPQTAEVDRKKAKAEIQYDGNPKFTKIESTAISYAENADKTVLLINNKYYCVDDAIWFVSPNATGPWEVCVEVPGEVQDIPASSPVYNVKYVYVYDYTPSVVYVGYTPGYYGSYVHYGTVVYGTGYWYRPWYAHYYYPRPVTWGFGIHYNPWTGWGFSYGVSYGWIGFGWHSYYGGWWGPCGYRYGYRHGYYHGYGNGYRHGYYHGYADGRRAGNVPAHYARTRPQGGSNIYRNRADGVRNTGVRPSTRPANANARPATRPGNENTRPSARPTNPSTSPSARPANPSSGNRPSTRPAQPGTRENNVYSDRNGNVYRRDNSGNWQQRSNGQWNNNRQGASNAPSNLNRDYNSRSRGTQRSTGSPARSASPAPRSRPSGGGRRN